MHFYMTYASKTLRPSYIHQSGVKKRKLASMPDLSLRYFRLTYFTVIQNILTSFFWDFIGTYLEFQAANYRIVTTAWFLYGQ